MCCPFPSDYPHKYGPEGGCADHSVFEKMKKYQSSVVEEPALVNPYHTATTLLSACHRSTQIITVICLYFPNGCMQNLWYQNFGLGIFDDLKIRHMFYSATSGLKMLHMIYLTAPICFFFARPAPGAERGCTLRPCSAEEEEDGPGGEEHLPALHPDRPPLLQVLQDQRGGHSTGSAGHASFHWDPRGVQFHSSVRNECFYLPAPDLQSR